MVNATTRCSAGAITEPLAGSAPLAAGWLLIHVQRSWGANAVQQLVPAHVLAWANQQDYKVLLVRQHISAQQSHGHQYWISRGTHPLMTGVMPSLADIPQVEQSVPAEPLLVICTNGARDQCCAIDGLALRKSLSGELSSNDAKKIWEGTHIGGHRFAPTCLYLPGNLVLGRLTVDGALALVQEETIPRENVRGRTHLSPCHQLLESQLADYQYIEWELNNGTCEDSQHVHRGHLNGNSLAFQIDQQQQYQRPESCGGESVFSRSLTLAQIM